nr:glycosyltransferase family 4 protein [Xanthomonas sp.]
MIEELRAQGWQVRVLALGGGYPAPSAQECAQAEARFAALADGAVVLVDGLAYGAMHALAAREHARLRLVALVHHPLALETGLDPARAQQLLDSERQALQLAHAVVATSHSTARQLQALFGLPAQRVHVAPPGCDRAASAAPREASAQVRLLSVGALIPRKGLDLLVDALAPLRELPWTLRIVGAARDAPTAAALRAQVARHGLEQRIELVGEVDDVACEYAQADVFVLPSRYEGYGMVFAEALAAGLPVLGCDAGAVAEVVPEDAGLLVPVDDVAALGDALRRLITDAALRARLATGARHAARSLPQWRDSAAALARALAA